MKVGSISGSLTRLVDNTSYLIEGANITITTGSNGAITISSTGGGGGGSGDAYFDSTVAGSIFTSGSAAFIGNQDEWGVIDSPVDKGTDVFFYVSGSIGSKNGPSPGVSLFSGDMVVSGSFFSEGNTLEVTGTVIAVHGFSGSLTTLTDGTSYLIAGNNITIVTQSNGSVVISSTASGTGDSYFDSTVAGSIFTTGSAAFVDQESVTSPSDKGTDVFFYVSGSIGSKDGPSPGVALFSGDLTVSGSLFAIGDVLEISGTLSVSEGISGSLTTLADGTSYLIAGDNISIVSQSNGSILISNTFVQTDDFFDSTTAGSIFTTGSAAFKDQESIASPADKGTDVFFYVSGAIGSKDGPTPGVALFSGDVVVSGSMFAEGNRFEMSGTLLVTEGISGSLTTLVDGTSYLVAGDNISIVSQSNGSILISNTFSQVDDFFDSTTAGSIFTTGSAAFKDQESIDSPSDKGTDVFFYVSGSIGSKDGPTPGVSLFSGDVVVSGSMFTQGDVLEVTGTLIVTNGISGSLTTLADGTSYLIAGNNISIVSQSNGSIVISNTFVQADDFFDSTTAGSIFTSGSAAFVGPGDEWNVIDSPSDKGTDVFFYVSGSISGNGNEDKKSLFGGDTVISGTLLSRAAAFKGQESIDSPADKGTDVFFYASGSVAAVRSAVSLFGGFVVISGSMVQGNFGASGGTTGQYSRAHGERTSVTGIAAHAEGRFTLAQGNYSHAEGDSTFTSGPGSHAEGLDSATYASYSHAEGRSTEARGVYSHAEGYDSIPRADYSHAEGRDTETIIGALYSHAEGSGSITLGEASHAGGLCTIASGSFQTVFGKYNLRSNVDSLFIIGNGTADSNANRSDVVRVQPGTLGAGQLQVSGSMSVSGSYSGNTNTLSGAGTIDSAGHSMLLTSTGASQAITLADGTWPGQLKYVVANSGYSGATPGSVITPTNALGYTSVTFDTSGQAVTFFWTGSKWVIVGSYGAIITP